MQYMCVCPLEQCKQLSIISRSGHAKSSPPSYDRGACSFLPQPSSEYRTKCPISYVLVFTSKYHPRNDQRGEESGYYWSQVVSCRCRSSQFHVLPPCFADNYYLFSFLFYSHFILIISRIILSSEKHIGHNQFRLRRCQLRNLLPRLRGNGKANLDTQSPR